MTRAAMQLALDALVDVARDLATSQCAELYAALGDRSPQRHAAAQRDVDQIEAAIEALRAALARQGELVAWQWGSTDCVICAMDGYTPPRGQEWRPLYAAPQTAPVAQPTRCVYCDDSGDVHGFDGEWRGICTCPAGDAIRCANKIGGPL